MVGKRVGLGVTLSRAKHNATSLLYETVQVA